MLRMKKAKVPETVEIIEQLSRRVFIATFKKKKVALKLFTLDDLYSCAAQIKHVNDEPDQAECDYKETNLEDRVLYSIKVHFLIQEKLGISLTTEFFDEGSQEWISNCILEEKCMSSIQGYEVLASSFVQLIHVFGVKFDLESETFISRGQSIGMIFPFLGQPVMDFTRNAWVPNNIYLSSLFISESNISVYFRKVVSSILFLFTELNIVHKDIKIENICTDLNNSEGTITPVIIDFGESQILGKSKKLRDAYGTHALLPPEAFTCSFPSPGNENDFGYSAEKREVWSLGCLLHTLIFGYPPNFKIFLEKSPIEFQFKLFDSNEVINIPSYSDILKVDISKSLKRLICKLLSKNPIDRPKLKEILEDPWIKEVGKW
ncbi:putative serine/threonine protein kinase [Cryptosporidium felis]|nr:putative serine/threonine protein kinase [Cryptosporidium felis]